MQQRVLALLQVSRLTLPNLLAIRHLLELSSR